MLLPSALITPPCQPWQVTVENADNALILTRIDHATLLDVTVATTAARWAPPDAVWRREGHHAILLTACHDVLVSRCVPDLVARGASQRLT